jgi:hypothetical protein
MHAPYIAPLIDTARDREISEIVATLAGAGPLERRQLARLVHADLWGPGRFSPALHKAVAQGKVRCTGRGLYALAPGTPGPEEGPPPADQGRPGPATEPQSSPEQHVVPARGTYPGPAVVEAGPVPLAVPGTGGLPGPRRPACTVTRLSRQPCRGTCWKLSPLAGHSRCRHWTHRYRALTARAAWETSRENGLDPLWQADFLS